MLKCTVLCEYSYDYYDARDQFDAWSFLYRKAEDTLRPHTRIAINVRNNGRYKDGDTEYNVTTSMNTLKITKDNKRIFEGRFVNGNNYPSF